MANSNQKYCKLFHGSSELIRAKGSRCVGTGGLPFAKGIVRVMRNGKIAARFSPIIFSTSSEMSVPSQMLTTELVWTFHPPCAIISASRQPTSSTGNLLRSAMCRPARGEATEKTTISLSLGGRWRRTRNRTSKVRRTKFKSRALL